MALLSGDDTTSRYTVEPRAHARVMLPMLDELLAEAQLRPLQLDGVAFVRGPGAFTGVRIATAAAQAIALGADIPALPVSTLATIACGVFRQHECDKVAVAIDARMGEVYWGTYKRQGEQNLMEPVLVDEERVCDPSNVPPLDSEWIAAGTGWAAWEAQLLQASNATLVSGIEPLPHAENVLAIGREMFMQNRGVAPEQAIPVYLRNDVARTEAQRATRQ